MAHSRHAYDRDQGCGALNPPADDCASSAQPLGHPHQDRHPGNGINTTCIEPQDIMALRQDISARLDFIALRDFIYSVYSDRPEVAPTPAPDVRDHFERPLSFYDKNCSQSISPGSVSPHSFFHDSLVSDNWRAFDDCMHDSSRSRPHTVHVTRVEQPSNAMEESKACKDLFQLLFKMWQCGVNNAFATVFTRGGVVGFNQSVWIWITLSSPTGGSRQRTCRSKRHVCGWK